MFHPLFLLLLEQETFRFDQPCILNWGINHCDSGNQFHGFSLLSLLFCTLCWKATSSFWKGTLISDSKARPKTTPDLKLSHNGTKLASKPLLSASPSAERRGKSVTHSIDFNFWVYEKFSILYVFFRSFPVWFSSESRDLLPQCVNRRKSKSQIVAPVKSSNKDGEMQEIAVGPNWHHNTESKEHITFLSPSQTLLNRQTENDFFIQRNVYFIPSPTFKKRISTSFFHSLNAFSFGLSQARNWCDLFSSKLCGWPRYLSPVNTIFASWISVCETEWVGFIGIWLGFFSPSS